MSEFDAQLIIIGAGPVGMTAALEAAQRGVSVVMIEARPENSPAGAKCNTVAARTMETFRRYGLADEVAAQGLPDDFPTDVAFSTAVTGMELTRLTLPSRAERARGGFADSDWRSPEPMVRVSQIYLEPVLAKAVAATAHVRVMYETRAVGLTQDAESVTVTVEAADGAQEVLRAQYLIGSDGGASFTRKTLGSKLQGDVEIARTRSTLIKAPGVKALFRDRPLWMNWIVNHNVRGVLVAIDGEDTWLVHRALNAGETDFETVDMHKSIRDLLRVGPDFEYEVLSHEDWVGRRMVAERMREGRIFLAGDAAHLWVPFAGYGMNAGIADGVHIAWLIANELDGWAGPEMLNAYVAERNPITEQVSRHAMKSMTDTMDALGKNSVPRAFASKYNPAGFAMRKVMSSKLARINEAQFLPAGLNFGYYYDASPIIVGDGATCPDFTMDELTPSTVPGCRMPHIYTGGASVYDGLGPVYTLICFGQADAAPMVAAFKEAGVPLTTLNAERPQGDPAFAHDFLIVRRDQHVAWRGNAMPDNPQSIVAKLAGFDAAEGAMQ